MSETQHLLINSQLKLNEYFSTIGFGRYQFIMFLICGMGWCADNMWFTALSVIIPQITMEFQLIRWMMGLGTSSTILGCFFGAGFWGYISDILGRQPAFIMTLLIATISGFFASLSPNMITLCFALFLLGFSIGGNLPIDGMLFLEFIPPEKQSLLTLMSLFWPIGQLITSILSWKIIPSRTCSSIKNCSWKSNYGWRIVLFVLSCVTLCMLLIRYYFVRYESPKFLRTVKKYRKAAEILNKLAEKNGKILDVSETDLYELNVISSNNKTYSALFDSEIRKTTICIIFIWIFMSMGYTMFNSFLMVFFHQNESSNSLQKYVLVSIFGIPGSILGMYLSDSSLGRKGTMIAASFVTASFLYLFTVFISPFEQLILSCVISFAQNAMYGVLYAYTPELFHVSIRGKATGLANSLGRLSGVIAPLLTGFLLDYSMYIPLWLSASMIYTCTFLFCMLPA